MKVFERRKEKAAARTRVKKHYAIFVMACLIAAFLGSAYASSLTTVQSSNVYSLQQSPEQANEYTSIITADTVISQILKNNIPLSQVINGDGALAKLLEGNFNESIKAAENTINNLMKQDIRFGNVQISFSKGVLSGVINSIASGKIFLIIFQAFMTVTKSASAAYTIFIVIAAILLIAITIFLRDGYKVVYSRIFLEGQNYDYVKASRFMFLFRVKRYVKSSWTLFVTSFLKMLWDFTIIGGIIKRYSYFMVRYIVAENPDIGTLEAIKLSREMMNGHKKDLFITELSFIPWFILGLITFGFSRLLYSNPYQECTTVSFYCYVRELAKEKGILNSDLLNDKYLYEKADTELINSAYSHSKEFLEHEDEIKQCIKKNSGNFFARKFGIILNYSPEEDAFNDAIEKREKINEYKHILSKEQYPGRLYPLEMTRPSNRLNSVHYLRRYSVLSIIVLFFVCCFIGWSWEVLLHLVEDGVFVNRGTMHGPWLPIYGTGGLLILLVLYRFRDRPVLEAVSTILLCGVLEYFGHWMLEVMFHTEWWDYSGYFLNFNGRVCAEGLLVFMIAGMAIVYALAPVIDNYVRRINKKTLKTVCIILLCCFFADLVYSRFNPNTGKGITDYGDDKEIIAIQE